MTKSITTCVCGIPSDTGLCTHLIVEPHPQPAPETGEWSLFKHYRNARGERTRILDFAGVVVAETQTEAEANQIIAEHAAVPRLVEALRFQRQALAELIDDFGVDGHPRLHASLANMRDDIDTALTTLRRSG
jgi:hypothetical protein